MTIIAFNRYWVIRWQCVVVSLFAAAFLASLSCWQLLRAAEKKQTLDRIAQWQAVGPLNTSQLLTLGTKEQDGVQVEFLARWIEPMVWLLDNQLVDGRAGYDVVIAVNETDFSRSSLVTPISANAILVNLGWVAAPTGRDQLPEINIPENLKVNGVFRVGTKGLLLGTNLEDKGRWPMRIQQVDAESLSPYVKKLMTSGLIYQQGPSPFYVHYQSVILPPERHSAYALQWALLAVAVLAIALAASATKERVHDQP